MAGVSGCSTFTPGLDHTKGFEPVAAVQPPYKIGPGDDLSVILPYNPELNYEGPVGPDGRFTMPVAGTVPARGKTVPEMERSIDLALEQRGVIQNAGASISVRHYGGVVYVAGEVKLPGAFPLQSGMDPLQAIAVAGGMLDTARTNKVVIIRRDPQGKVILHAVDIDAFTHGGDQAQDVALRRSDIVYVPKSSIAEVDQWVDQYINKTLPFNRNLDYSISHTTATTSTLP